MENRLLSNAHTLQTDPHRFHHYLPGLPKSNADSHQRGSEQYQGDTGKISFHSRFSSTIFTQLS